MHPNSIEETNWLILSIHLFVYIFSTFYTCTNSKIGIFDVVDACLLLSDEQRRLINIAKSKKSNVTLADCTKDVS